MRYRHLTVLFAAAAVAIAAACNGGGPSLDDYFAQIEPLFNAANEGSAVPDPLLDQKLAAAQSDEERVLVFQEFLSASEAITRAVAVQLDGIEPVKEAQDAHEEAIQTNTELADLLGDLLSRTEDVASPGELEDLLAELEEPELTEARERRDEACSKLQEVADANEVDVDLDCPAA